MFWLSNHSQGHGSVSSCLPGAPAGMLKVEGLLPRRCRMFDTPGVPHPFQLHARLNPEEVPPANQLELVTESLRVWVSSCVQQELKSCALWARTRVGLPGTVFDRDIEC